MTNIGQAMLTESTLSFLGLGLPLAKAIIEAHGGTIEVDSEAGRGTIFTLIFLIPSKL